MVEQPLWAPWRMEFIKSHCPKSGCVFCEIAKGGTKKDSENLVVHRGTGAFVVMNRYPYNSGHLLVTPSDHVGELGKLSKEVSLELHGLLEGALETLKRVMSPQGFNIGMNLGAVAGAGIQDHLHWHIVPRWQGDTNFMPVLGDSKVISEHLVETHAQLVKHWKAG